MSRISQEFYCNDCYGYFFPRINTAITAKAEIVCPNCGRKHPRWIHEGQVFDKAPKLKSDWPEQEILSPKTSYSKEPLTDKMKKKHNGEPRDGEVIADRSPLYERWLEVAARERGEIDD